MSRTARAAAAALLAAPAVAILSTVDHRPCLTIRRTAHRAHLPLLRDNRRARARVRGV